MIIKNDYIKIKNGTNYEFTNTITLDYFELFSKCQYDPDFFDKSKNKKLEKVYIKTSDDITPTQTSGYKSYYNLINIQDIKEKSDYLTVDSNNDFISFSNIPTGESPLIYLNDVSNLYTGLKITLLAEVEIENMENNSLIGFSIVEVGFVTINKQNNVYNISAMTFDEDGNINQLPIGSTKDNKFVIAIKTLNLATEFVYYDKVFQMSQDNIKNKGKIRLSVLKENNTKDEASFVEANDYTYNKYSDFSDLASEYNYRLSLITQYYNHSNSRIDTYYSYNNISGYEKSDGITFTKTTNINELANKKITKLAFGNNDKIYAYVDISNSDIVIQTDEELYIERKDIISSDSKFTGNGLIPAHLSPLGFDYDGHICYGVLYSIGVGSVVGQMLEEYVVKTSDIKQVDSKTFQVTIDTGEEDTLTPHENLQPNSNLVPLIEVHREQAPYPSLEIQPSNTIYPSLTSNKYIMFKYQLYYIEDETNEIIKLDKFYIMNFYTENKGTTRVNTKYEGS